jgi:hypothetical protein
MPIAIALLLGRRVCEATAWISVYDPKGGKVFANRTLIALRMPNRVTLR